MAHESLIEEVIRKTMVEIARLATRGGARSSLAGVTDQVFMQLSRELERQGVTKTVIADMFGMAVRTYHRKVQHLRQQQAQHRTVCEAVLELVRGSESISVQAVQQRFVRYPGQLVASALNDLVHTGRIRRAGWGDNAVFCRVALVDEAPEPADSWSAEPVRDVRVAG